MGGLFGPFGFGVSSSGSGPQVLIASKAVDTTRTSSTPVADPELQFAALAAGRYALEAALHLPSQNPQGGITPGFSTTGTVDTGYFVLRVADSFGTSFPNTYVTNVGSQINVAADVGKNILLHLVGTLVVTTTGLLSLSWGTQDGSNQTTLGKGSWMRVTKAN